MESSFKKKLRKEFDRFLLRRLPAFNASRSAFYVQFRPDFDLAYGRFEPGVVRAVDEFLADKPEKPVLIPDKSGSAALVKV